MFGIDASLIIYLRWISWKTSLFENGKIISMNMLVRKIASTLEFETAMFFLISLYFKCDVESTYHNFEK